ncbi:MAG: CBS domain-containing protein [Dermatophilaceae bacterium]|nr:CBS domain-containing protein [Intrasporangiaceae bacterium]
MFLAAFSSIEHFLTAAVHGGRQVGNPGFNHTLDQFTDKHRHSLRRDQVETLKALADIRGFLSHSLHFGGRLSVDPTRTTVAVIEQIRDHLISPPTALRILGGQKPTTIEPPRTLRAALQLMHRHDFSQLPVYDDTAFVGLLTNNAVARWVADQMHQHDRLAEDAPVSEVLPFAEDSDRVEHVGRDITAAQAVATFAESASTGTPLTALIVTHAGKPTETPISIIVSADLPRLAHS